jgi:hypothetical protein
VKWSYFAVHTLVYSSVPVIPATYPVPLIDTPPRLLSSVLHLLELSDRDGAECEELDLVLAPSRPRRANYSHPS